MGYDFHITRAEHWSRNESQGILAEEWLDLIKSDPELVPAPENGQYFVIWRGATKYPETWFNWVSGNITTKNPDKATLHKMLEIAPWFNALCKAAKARYMMKLPSKSSMILFSIAVHVCQPLKLHRPTSAHPFSEGCSDEANPRRKTQV